MSHEILRDNSPEASKIPYNWLKIDYATLHQRSQENPEFKLHDALYATVENITNIQLGIAQVGHNQSSVPYIEHGPNEERTRRIATFSFYSYKKEDVVNGLTEGTKRFIATSIFKNQFLDQIVDIEDPDIFTWAISEALNPENLPEKYSEQRTPLNHALKVVRALSEHVNDSPESDQIIETLMSGVRSMRKHEKTKQHSYAGYIVGMLYPITDWYKTTSDKYLANYTISKKLKEAGKELRNEFKHANEPASLIARATHGDVPQEPTELYLENLENAEVYLSNTPINRAQLSRSIAAMRNLLRNSNTSEAEKYITLLDHLAQKDGAQSIGHIVKLANAITPAIDTELGQPLRKLDHLSIDDYAIAVDRISAQATKEVEEGSRKQALRSIGQCARILAERAVEKKKAQGVLTLGDLAVRYPDATPHELEIIIGNLQDKTSEQSSHQLYRSLRAGNRKSHAQHKVRQAGYGLLS